LLRAQRREVHAEVARAIEELHGERLEEQVEVLARHYSLAEEWELAVRYGRQAAEKAQKLSQAHQAVHLYEQAVNLLQYLPESPERKRLLGDLLLDTVWSFLTIGQFDRVLEASGRVESIARDLDDRVRLGKALIGYGMAHVYKGDAEATERRLLQSIETLDGTGEDAAVSWAKHVLGASYLGQGLWPRVEPLLAPSLETYQRLNLRQDYFYGSFVLPYVAASGQLSYALSVQGRIEEARQLITAAGAPELDGVSNLTSKVTLMLWHALHVALTGEDRLNAASRAAEHARIAENAELPFLQLGAYVSRTNVELAAEDFNALRADGVKALQIVAARSLRTGHVANLRYNLALAEVALGDREAAGRHYEAGRELVELSPHWWGPRYEFLQGLLLATGDAPDVNAAQAAFERSIAGDEEVGAVVPAAQTRYHLALLLGRHGGHERVRAMLDELARQFAAWGIPVWEARCRQALSRLPAS
jgi:tetratricopeptide (TPR) repeat protein